MKNTFKLIGLALVASALAFATSCEKDEEKKDTAVVVTDVTLAPTTKTLTVGETFPLTATVAPKDATDATVEWTSSSTATATVSDGVVTAVAVGTATITVTTKDGGKTDTCVVTVTEPPLTYGGQVKFTVTNIEDEYDFSAQPKDSAWTAVAYMTTYEEGPYGYFRVVLYAYDYNTLSDRAADYENCGYGTACYDEVNAAMAPHVNISFPIEAATTAGTYTNADFTMGADYYYAYDPDWTYGNLQYDSESDSNHGIEAEITEIHADGTISGKVTVKLWESVYDSNYNQNKVATGTVEIEFKNLPKNSDGAVTIE
jgi:hypothetical protein